MNIINIKSNNMVAILNYHNITYLEQTKIFRKIEKYILT